MDTINADKKIKKVRKTAERREGSFFFLEQARERQKK